MFYVTYVESKLWFTLKEHKKTRFISNIVKRAYFWYFGVKLGDQNKSLAPHVECKTWIEHLRQWSSEKSRSLKLVGPVVWRESSNHVDDCYFLLGVLLVRIERIAVNIPWFTLFKTPFPSPRWSINFFNSTVTMLSQDKFILSEVNVYTNQLVTVIMSKFRQVRWGTKRFSQNE